MKIHGELGRGTHLGGHGHGASGSGLGPKGEGHHRGHFCSLRHGVGMVKRKRERGGARPRGGARGPIVPEFGGCEEVLSDSEATPGKFQLPAHYIAPPSAPTERTLTRYTAGQ